MDFETENIEFKLQITDELYKEVIAFANTTGGTIYIGIDNNGNVIGIDNVDEDCARITNGIRDAIAPDITMFTKCIIQENKVVKLIISEGANKPYYLKSKGLKSSGVYIRQGTSSVPASPEKIRSMIKETDGDVFENMRSIVQELTFDYTRSAFERYNIEFSRDKYRVLGILLDNSEVYTNLALLLSDQCQHTIKIAFFADSDKTIFRDSKEFKGSVFKQLDDAFSYLSMCNKTSATFKGLERIEKSDYHEETIREALLNALVHRDYSFSGSIIINVNDEEIEFVSIGGLLPGLSPEDIRSGISQPRNKNLADIFHRLHLIESYGTGIRKIYNLYKNCSRLPKIEVTQNTFKIVLPNMNVATEKKENVKITFQMKLILDYIDENGQITDGEIQELLKLKKTRAFTIAKKMRECGLLRAVGRGSNKIYVK